MIKNWKDIEGYEGLYRVSDIGQVMSYSRQKTQWSSKVVFSISEKIIKPQLRGFYLNVVLHKNNKRVCISIHRLVAQAFILNPENKSTVNHKNGNKVDNRVENLEWATQAEQVQHSYRTQLQKPNNIKTVINLQTGIFYDSLTEASKTITHIKHKSLHAMVKGYNTNKSNFIYV